MRENAAIAVAGQTCVLVPYCKRHVERYHAWMQSEELLALTASEPLTEAEEYEMQRSWREDPDKCTFILLLPDATDSVPDPPTTATAEVEAMVGDVNLFLNGSPDDPDDASAAEIDVMVAEAGARGKGVGTEAVLLMLHFAVTQLKLTRFYAKISLTNDPSLALFNKLGFTQVSTCLDFNEATLELDTNLVECRKALEARWTTIEPRHIDYTLGDQ